MRSSTITRRRVTRYLGCCTEGLLDPEGLREGCTRHFASVHAILRSWLASLAGGLRETLGDIAH